MWPEKHGRIWRVRDTIAGRKETISPKGGFPSKTAAKQWMIGLLADKSRGEYIDPRAGRLALGDWIDAWWPSYSASLKPSARISAEGIIRRYIRPAFGAIALDDITPLHVQAWTAQMLAGTHLGARNPLSVKTIRNVHGLLHKIFSAAIWQRLIKANPCERTGLPERQHKEMRFLTEPEAARLIAATSDHYRPLMLLFLGTGLRFAEAVGLKVKHVDVLVGHLMVMETMQELADHSELVFVTPKSQRSRRKVTFTKALAAELVPLVANKGREELVFRAPKGGPVRYRVFYNGPWTRAKKGAGIEGLRPHDLRHTHAAWLISAGHPLTAVSRRLGHASISVTSDMYGHLLPSVDEDIMATLDRALPILPLGGIVGEPSVDSGPLTSIADHSGPGQSA